MSAPVDLIVSRPYPTGAWVLHSELQEWAQLEQPQPIDATEFLCVGAMRSTVYGHERPFAVLSPYTTRG